MKRVKEASGLSVFLMEELGDARLRCNQLKDFLDEATELIEKSEQRDHFFEVAGHLLYGIPDTMMRMEKALSAAAMAVAKWDYEEIKEDLRPEKAEQLEDALKDVRVRRVKRKSSEPEASMKVQEAAEQLQQIAASIESTGQINTESLAHLISSLEGDSVRTASANTELAVTLRRVAAGLNDDQKRPSRLMLASILRRVLGETIEVKVAATKNADGADPDLEAQYNMTQGFEFIRGSARLAYLRGATHQMRQAFDQLAGIVSEIGLMCDSVGANDVAGLAIRMSKAVRLARRYLKPDVLDNMVLAADKSAGTGVATQMLSAFNEGVKSGRGDLRDAREAADRLHDAAKEAVKYAFQPSMLSKSPIGTFSDISDRIYDLGFYIGAASTHAKTASEEKESRFEEGKPADPTENMSDDEADQWKANTDKYEDKFKAASDEKESRFEEGKPADPTDDMSEEDAKEWKSNTDKYEDKFKSAGTKAKGLVPKPRPKKYSGEEKESRFEEGKPADPTENMSEDDAATWKTEHDKNKDKFKAARAKQASPGEVKKLIKRMNDGADEKQTYAMLEEAFDAHRITQGEFRNLEREAESFFDPDYKTASESRDPWKA